jgi:hypothetical protein
MDLDGNNDQLRVLTSSNPGKEHGRREGVVPGVILDILEEVNMFCPYWDSKSSSSGPSSSHYTALMMCIEERK